MATLTTPTWTDNVSVVAATTLARNANTRATWDLRAKFGAYLFPRLGRGDTTVLSNGIYVLARRTINNAGIVHPAGPAPFLSQTAAASSTTVNADTALGATTLNVASTTGFAVGDLICIWDAGNTTFGRLEWARVSRVTDSTHLLLDAPLQFAHTAAQADTVRNKSEVLNPLWLDGGATWDIVIDFGTETGTPAAAVVQALGQTFDNTSSA